VKDVFVEREEMEEYGQFSVRKYWALVAVNVNW